MTCRRARTVAVTATGGATIKTGAEALADGKLSPDGVLHANKLSAKCASKYEVKPGGQYQRVDPAKLINKS